MSKCVLVRERGGTYETRPDAEIEDWDDVFWEADRIEHVEDLDGWGEWTAVYRVQLRGETLTYFVAGKKFSPEARRALARVYDLLLRWGRERREREASSEGEDQKPLASPNVGGEGTQG